MINQTPRGGARPGAGRKPVEAPAKPRSIRLTDADYEQLKSLGGADWIKQQLQAAKKS